MELKNANDALINQFLSESSTISSEKKKFDTKYKEYIKVGDVTEK